MTDPLTPLNPPGYEQTVFQPWVVPQDKLFMIGAAVGENNVQEDGPYSADDWTVDPITNIAMCGNSTGHPLFVRCIYQSGDKYTSVDGAGEPYEYVLRAVEPGEDPFMPPAYVDPTNGLGAPMPGDGSDAGSLTNQQREQMQNLGAES
jgi:hypothetical protein